MQRRPSTPSACCSAIGKGQPVLPPQICIDHSSHHLHTPAFADAPASPLLFPSASSTAPRKPRKSSYSAHTTSIRRCCSRALSSPPRSTSRRATRPRPRISGPWGCCCTASFLWRMGSRRHRFCPAGPLQTTCSACSPRSAPSVFRWISRRTSPRRSCGC